MLLDGQDHGEAAGGRGQPAQRGGQALQLCLPGRAAGNPICACLAKVQVGSVRGTEVIEQPHDFLIPAFSRPLNQGVTCALGL